MKKYGRQRESIVTAFKIVSVARPRKRKLRTHWESQYLKGGGVGGGGGWFCRGFGGGFYVRFFFGWFVGMGLLIAIGGEYYWGCL